MKWRLASRILCDKKVLPKLEVKFYKAILRLTMLYRVESLPVKNSHDIRDNVEVTSVEDMMQEMRFR
ncbi:hypothetical protein H5410_025336 [Solanum commersonii]|uniref:Uncharacterized protein n=1 Tax=Solanum commersonii TaxID=4109 RepID=A0A9J5YXN4_SOLCO|nr:hypothetical protein H5410_025336 [Solanum commersonii]